MEKKFFLSLARISSHRNVHQNLFLGK